MNPPQQKIKIPANTILYYLSLSFYISFQILISLFIIMISAFVLVWIELFFVLLLSIITKNIKENKNIKLALDFIYVMLFLAVLKLVMFIYMTFNNISLCSLSRQLYC